VQNLLRLDGSNIAITWVDMSGAKLGLEFVVPEVRGHQMVSIEMG
jgi:hypothetical protein